MPPLLPGYSPPFKPLPPKTTPVRPEPTSPSATSKSIGKRPVREGTTSDRPIDLSMAGSSESQSSKSKRKRSVGPNTTPDRPINLNMSGSSSFAAPKSSGGSSARESTTSDSFVDLDTIDHDDSPSRREESARIAAAQVAGRRAEIVKAMKIEKQKSESPKAPRTDRVPWRIDEEEKLLSEVSSRGKDRKGIENADLAGTIMFHVPNGWRL